MTIRDRVFQQKIIAIVRGLAPDHMLGLAAALFAGGIDLMEVTFNQAKPETWVNTAQAIRSIDRAMGDKVAVGAGTVITQEQLAMAADAGAKYIVTPNTNPELIGKIKQAGLAAFPGAMTPSEMAAAHMAGADAVKVFPAGILGPAYIKAVRAPLGCVPMLAVGGIDENNAAGYLAAGCCGVGVGGNLVNKNWIEHGEWERITALAKKYRKAVGSV